MVSDPDGLREESRLLREKRDLVDCPDCGGQGKRAGRGKVIECLRCDGEGKIDLRGD